MAPRKAAKPVRPNRRHGVPGANSSLLVVLDPDPFGDEHKQNRGFLSRHLPCVKKFRHKA